MSDFAETIAINARDTAIVARRRGEASLRIDGAQPIRLAPRQLAELESLIAAGAPMFVEGCDGGRREIEIGAAQAAPLLALARRALSGEG